ncbi:MAG: LacI family DNA-binding transcriptional regulator [Verrucomicrobiae bacterium]
MHPSPTQKQIAAKLGVSQTLVSRALSGRAGEIGASLGTIEKIRRAAEEWNYQPSATALALLGAPTRTIGVVVKNFDDPYFGRLIGALQVQAQASRHSLLLTGCRKEDLSGLQKHRVDGVILAGSDFQPEGLAAFAREGMPVVQIGTGTPFPGGTQIHLDEEAGIGDLVAHLSGLGHREIGFVAKEVGANLRRGELLRQALRACGFSVREKAFLLFDGSQGAESVARALTAMVRMPTAVVAAEDSIAMPLLRGLYDAGLRVPQDISIAGIDDISAAAQTIPPLTTLRQPISEMAAAAFLALDTSGPHRSTVSIPGKLIVRKSCAPVRLR